MRKLCFCTFEIALFSNFRALWQGDENYYYYDGGKDYDYKIDPCDYHGSIQESHGCHKKKLPKQNMENLFGNLVKKCCFSHGFTETISESCEVTWL